MTSSGRFSPTEIGTIDAALTRFADRETRRRRLEAEQLADLGEAMLAAVGPDSRSGAAGRSGTTEGSRTAGSSRTAGGPGTADRELRYRSLRLELAALLGESEQSAERLLQAAYDAVEHFPATLRALRGGEISLAHLRVVTTEGAPLTAGDTAGDVRRRADYEVAVLDVAREESPNRLRPIARRLAASASEHTLRERHEAAVARRYIRVVDADDGMADLTAYLPAEEAHAIYDRVTRIAQQQRGSGSAGSVASERSSGSAGSAVPSAERRARVRPLPEARADAFRDLLLGGDAAHEAVAGRVRGHIQVVVPVGLLGLADSGQGARTNVAGAADETAGPRDLAAELVGYGPIDSSTARRLAAEAESWERIGVDAAGVVTSVDRYRPSPQLRRLLRARDLHCRAPGCRVPAHRCDVDHTIDAACGGPTSTSNLAHLCRGHHTVKHHTDWNVTQLSEGTLQWTSPTGREYRDRPASRVRFRRDPEYSGTG